MADASNTSTVRDHIQTAYDRKSISTFVYRFGLSGFHEHGMKLSAFWTVFKMEVVHLPVGLDKITDHLRDTIFLVSTELIRDARKKIVRFIVD